MQPLKNFYNKYLSYFFGTNVNQQIEKENTIIRTLPHEIWLHIFKILIDRQQDSEIINIILLPLIRTSNWMCNIIYKLYNFEGYIHHKSVVRTYVSLKSINLVEWAIDSGMCPWNEYSCSSKRRYKEVMEWLGKTNYDWGAKYFPQAIKKSRLDVLKWLKKNEFPCNKVICVLALGSGNLEVLEWLYQNNFIFSPIIYSKAAAAGELSVLKWLREKSIPWEIDTCVSAAMKGHLEVLKWLKENQCPWDFYIASYAARGGHIHVLEWLKENEDTFALIFDEDTCSSAARGGHIETIKWLQKNGCPWNSGAFYNAAEGGHMETLKWLKNYGCPWNDCLLNSNATVYAVIGGELETLIWLKENGCPCDEATSYEAARKRDTTILKYLLDNGCPWPENPVFRNLNPKVSNMLVEKGCGYLIDHSYVSLSIKTHNEVQREIVELYCCNY